MTFLNKVYMSQPQGSMITKFPDYICKLKKVIHGLKQAPQVWFLKLSWCLIKWGFKCSKSDASMIIYDRDRVFVVLLIYVDDILVTDNDSMFITNLITWLNKVFSLKDLGDVSFFLGFEVTKIDNGLHLCQAKYIKDLLDMVQLKD